MKKTIYKKGDVTEAVEMFIMHGCNAQGKMGSGVAAAIAKKYPGAFKEYYDRYRRYGLRVGEFSLYTHHDGRIVINAITQRYYGRDGRRYVSYDGLAEIAKKLEAELGPVSVAIPKIGDGLGGGKWEVIVTILETYAPNIQWIVYEL